MNAEPNKYDHLSIEMAIVADGTATGRAMADRVIAQFTLMLVDPDITRRITEHVTEDVEGKCLKALTAGVSAGHVDDWRQWYATGYAARIDDVTGKSANHPFKMKEPISN